MIHPLRQRHRLNLTILAVVLPLAFALGLLARKASPTMHAAPSALSHEPFALPRMIFEKEDLWPGIKITTRVYTDAPSGLLFALELQPREDVHAPDILVYWSARTSGNEQELLKEAHLLGALAGRQKRSWLLPGTMERVDGKVILYSLGHQAVVASASLTISQGGQP